MGTRHADGLVGRLVLEGWHEHFMVISSSTDFLLCHTCEMNTWECMGPLSAPGYLWR